MLSIMKDYHMGKTYQAQQTGAGSHVEVRKENAHSFLPWLQHVIKTIVCEDLRLQDLG
ncbi:hypothetical protein ACFL2Q_09955 [Thermodesulfobacteriota bacterium]